MTVNEAYDKLIKKIGEVNVAKCFEYETLYVFNIGTDRMIDGRPALLGMFSVNKKTGEVRDFKPFHIPVDEYRNGKEVRGV